MGGRAVSGARLRAAREAAGLSLEALAARTLYSKPFLGLIETGKRKARHEHLVAYSRALNVSVETLEAPATSPVRAALEWLTADSPAARHTRAGRRVGTSLAGELEARVVELRHLDDSIGGRDLFPTVHTELATAQALVDCASFTEPVGRRLFVAVGELAQLAGWVASDAGRYADAALLARAAAAGAAQDATPIVRALLLERLAWADARARDTEGARRALDAVNDAYESRSPDIPEPEWVYWLNRAEIDVMAGRCFVELGDASRAEPLLSRAIDAYPPEHAREVALYRTWLAAAYARTGDLDAARETIKLAKRAAAQVNSSRLDRRINEIDRSVA
ncbi:helix-turn-helix domain-containing protein [Nocardia sp. NPDC088792]|uniref:helix-turn-helix domain-containing protein n=1 Tax=Nocardia sp. NPDC088792 TaxID=3364332 RepID=UPI003814A63D